MAEAVIAKVQAYLDARDKSVPSRVPYVFKFVATVDGAPSKTIVLDLVNFTISREDGPADVTATLAEEWIHKIFTNEVDLAEFVTGGHISIEGDRELLAKLKAFVAKLNSAE